MEQYLVTIGVKKSIPLIQEVSNRLRARPEPLSLDIPHRARSSSPKVLFRMPTGNYVLINSFEPSVFSKPGNRILLSGPWVKIPISLAEPLSLEDLGIMKPRATTPAARAVIVDYYFTAKTLIPQLREQIETLQMELREERELANRALAVAASVRTLSSILSGFSPEQISEIAGDVKVLLNRVQELQLAVEATADKILAEIRGAKLKLEAGDREGVKEALDRAERMAAELPSFAANNPWLEIIMKGAQERRRG
ncbi:MAG: hypothetical protein ABWK01_07910 [Infirmifilum sp.]